MATMTIRGTEYPLLYNGYAMYALKDFVGERKIYDILTQDTPEGFHEICEIASVLACQAELYRRYLGYDKQKMLQAQTIELLARPIDMVSMRSGIMEAFVEGMKTEDPEDEDIDLGLRELQSKSKKKD